MISYESGPIRRGLTGAILKRVLEIYPELNINLVIFIFTLLAIWLIVYLICIQASIKNSYSKFAIAASPVLYPLFFFNDAQGGGRKEILALIFITILSLLKDHFTIAKKKKIYFIWSLFLPLLVLCHEGIFFFLAPYLLFTIFILDFNSEKNSSFYLYKKIITKYIKLILPSFIALLFSFFYKNNTLSDIQLICNSWQKYYSDLNCINLEGSFKELVYYGFSNSGGIYQKLDIYIQWIFAFIYIFLISTSCLIPLITSKKSKNYTLQIMNNSIILFIFIFIVFIFNLPLYIFAVDYGRWISVSFSIFIIFCLGYKKNINNLANELSYYQYLPLKFKYHLNLLVRNISQNNY